MTGVAHEVDDSQTRKTQGSTLAYPIVHHTITKATYHLAGLTMNADGGVISGEAQPLGPGHQTYRKAISLDGDLYKFNAFKEKPLDEVHFYVDAWNLEDGGLSFSTAAIQRVDVYDLAVGRVIASYTSAALATAGVVTLIVFALKSSCPFVYTMDGDVAGFAGKCLAGYRPQPGQTRLHALADSNPRRHTLYPPNFRPIHRCAQSVTHDREAF